MWRKKSDGNRNAKVFSFSFVFFHLFFIIWKEIRSMKIRDIA